MNAIGRALVPVLVGLLTLPPSLLAQRQPGHPIGQVETLGNLIHLELDSGVVAPARLFDLDHHTLRFTPTGSGYRVETVPLVWDDEFGAPLEGDTLVFESFTFPFSGRRWDRFRVATGAITFDLGEMGEGEGGFRAPAGNRRGAGRSARHGFPMERYPLLETVGRTFVNALPGIAAFVKPNLRGQRHVKPLDDGVLVTWTLTEPAGTIQSFTWEPTVNRIQAALHENGEIELSYNDVSARDGVVGVFPMVTAGVEKPLATVADVDDTGDARLAPHLDVEEVALSAVDDLFLEATLETRGPVVQEGEPGLVGVTYRVALDTRRRSSADLEDAPVVWTVRGVGGGRFGGRGRMPPRYVASGAGVESEVTVEENTLSIRGILPVELAGAETLFVWADASEGEEGTADRVAPGEVELQGLRSPERDLSATTAADGTWPVAYEGFHWPGIPRPQDVACSVITALGDNFDFLASYSDFRVDNPEGGTPSTGPRGGNVSGIGSSTRNPEDYCSDGRFQWMFYEPVSTSAIQIQESSPDGRMTDYDYAMSQIGHELGHRWAADASAVVDGDTIELGPTHWGAQVHLPAAFPYGRSYEADAMGGSTWKENDDGTFTQLDRDYYSPAKGFSWLGLYLMGLARPEEVPPFFVLENLERTGRQDAEGHPIFKGRKRVVTIDDVVEAMGPREPDFEHAQKTFNTAIVVVTLPGEEPTQELLRRARDIREHWIRYWSTVTGGRSVMRATPDPN